MMKVTSLVLGIALLTPMPLASDGTACAVCSCMPSRPPTVARDSAHAVFSGRVVELLDRPVPLPDSTLRGLARRDAELEYFVKSAGRLRVTIAVDAVWKGVIKPSMEVYTSTIECCTCGYPFELGKEYLVYAYRASNGQLHTSICTRTRLLTQAAEDLVALGPGVSSKWLPLVRPPPHN